MMMMMTIMIILIIMPHKYQRRVWGDKCGGQQEGKGQGKDTEGRRGLKYAIHVSTHIYVYLFIYLSFYIYLSIIYLCEDSIMKPTKYCLKSWGEERMGL
jgi:hypothetical protein